MKIAIRDNEYWWGGSVCAGHRMPITKGSNFAFDTMGELGGNGSRDQYAPLLLSSKGRYIWANEPFTATVENGVIMLDTDNCTLTEGLYDLRRAYLDAMSKHFAFSGKIPDKLFFEVPQYNTWIELGTNQTTENILNYAKSIVENGLPAGIIMIDEGWQHDYGIFEFNLHKIPNPKYLIEELHKLGFRVMLWVTPNAPCAGDRYQYLKNKGYLCRTSDGSPAIRGWWTGYSTVIDLSNPDAAAWMNEQLVSLIERFGVDGFKFDAADAYMYRDDDLTFSNCRVSEQTKNYNKLGVDYKFNEFRAGYDFGGKEIVSRLHDKNHSWDNQNGIDVLIPQTIMQGLLGYAYCCPDMVGGGMIVGNAGLGNIDEELYVRWAQASALMCMMQLSIGPWRILSEENYKTVKEYILLHRQFGSLIAKLAEETAVSGEPIVRNLEYQYPHEGYAEISDEFMLGDSILVAPVLVKGQRERRVVLPKGTWLSDKGEVFEGGQTITEAVPLERLCYYSKID